MFTGGNNERDQSNPALPSLPQNQPQELHAGAQGLGQGPGSGPLQPGTTPNSPGSGVTQIISTPTDKKPLSPAWNVALGAATTAAATMTRKRANARKQQNQNVRPQRALFCLNLQNPIRKLCIRVVEWRYPFSRNFFVIVDTLLQSSTVHTMSPMFPCLCEFLCHIVLHLIHSNTC